MPESEEEYEDFTEFQDFFNHVLKDKKLRDSLEASDSAEVRHQLVKAAGFGDLDIERLWSALHAISDDELSGVVGGTSQSNLQETWSTICNDGGLSLLRVRVKKAR